jgi:hypothetical protein
MIYLNVQRRRIFMRSSSRLLPILFALTGGIVGQQSALPSASLPDPAELFHRLEANQKNLEQLRRNYICLVQQEVTQLDGDGNVKKIERREYEEWYVAGESIRRTISKEGIPLDDKEKKKEEERVAKKEKEARERQAKRDRGEGDEDDLTVSDFLASSRYSNLRRETREGRELLAMDFEPNPAYKPHGRAQTLVNKLAGTIWIDERDLQIARLEAHMAKGMRVGGFLATLKEGSAFVFEQARVNDEVWMPSYVDGSIGARVLFKGVNQRLVNRFSNYRKFRTTSTVHIVGEEPK